MTHGPAPESGAAALYGPAVVTTRSSAMSPSGVVIMREVKPVPAPMVEVYTVFAPMSRSVALVVVTVPLALLEVLAVAEAAWNVARQVEPLQSCTYQVWLSR